MAAMSIEARKTEMELFKEMTVCRKVPKSEVKKQGRKIISTRWIDTDKGHRGKASYRSRLVATEINKDKRQDLFSATPLLETFRLLVADCAKGQWEEGDKGLVGQLQTSLYGTITLCRLRRSHAPCSWSRVPEEQSRAQEEEHQDDSAR